MVETNIKLGELALVIVEYFVESKLDKKLIKDHRALKDNGVAISSAMQSTAEQLWKEWAHKRLWIATFNLMPKKKELLSALKDAVNIFYNHPDDTTFAKVMTEILQDSNEFSQSVIQKAVGEYITKLTKELLVADKVFLENMRSLASPRILDIPGRVEELQVKQRTFYDSVMPKRILEDELKEALARFGKLPVRKIPEPVSIHEGSRFPTLFPNLLLVGRGKELRHLAVLLKGGTLDDNGQVVCVTGTEGIGKTALASEFVNRYSQFFAGGVFWLDFSDPTLIPCEIAACGGSDDNRPLDVRVKQVLSDWQSKMPRLLIFDNCEDTELLSQWLPPSGGSRVLITSRRKSWNPKLAINELPLGPLDRFESIAQLCSFRKDFDPDDPYLDLIASEMGDNPLALHMAGSFLLSYSKETSPKMYLKELHKLGSQNRSSSNAKPLPIEKNMQQTFMISKGRLDREFESTNMSLDLLKEIACFAPGELVPLELIKSGYGKGEVDPPMFMNSVNQLLKLGFIEENAAGNIWMNKTVSAYVIETISDEAMREKVELAVVSFASSANINGKTFHMQYLLPHLKYLTDQAVKLMDEQAASLSYNLGYFFYTLADFSNAQLYLEKALEIRLDMFGEEHPDTADSMNRLGILLEAMGKYQGARSYFEQALKIRRKILGKDHPDIIRNLNNLGELLYSMGDYAGSRSYYQQALANRSKRQDTKRSDASLILHQHDYFPIQKVFMSVLLLLSLFVNGWQIFERNINFPTLSEQVKTPIETGLFQSSAIIPGIPFAPSKTATLPPTQTHTFILTASSTSTRIIVSPSKTPSSTSKPMVIYRTNTPTMTEVPVRDTPIPTNTPIPSPTKTPVPTNTAIPPTNTAVPPTSTPVPPTNTPIPPTSTPVPPTVAPTNTEVPTDTPIIPTP